MAAALMTIGLLALRSAAALLLFLAVVHSHEQAVPFADWMATLKQPDKPYASCCGPADQVYVDSYEASDIDPDGFRAWISNKAIEIPGNKVIWDRVNPTGRGVLFLSQDGSQYVYCFCPASGV